MRKEVTEHSSSIIRSPQVSKYVQKWGRESTKQVQELKKKNQWRYFKRPSKNMAFKNGKSGILKSSGEDNLLQC